MDLLGDIGQADQLTTARAENAVLHQKVKDLSAQCQTLKLENATLQAEVEMYRQEHQTSSTAAVSATASALSQLSVTSTRAATPNTIAKPHAFLQSSGDNSNENLYCNMPELIFANCIPPGGGFNPVCTIMSDDGTLLISGAANGELTVVQWGAYHTTSASATSTESEPFVVESLAVTPSSGSGAATATTKYAATVMLDAPVVCIASLQQIRNLDRNTTLIAAGLMDGRVVLVTCTTRPVLHLSILTTTTTTATTTTRHAKYVTAVALAKQSTSPVADDNDTILLVSSSADGTLHISHISVAVAVAAAVVIVDSQDDSSSRHNNLPISVRHVQSFYHQDAISCLCYCNDTIYTYIRGTPHLTCIAVPPTSNCHTDAAESNNDYVVTTLHLNVHALDDHVSFAVLCLHASPLAAHGTTQCRYLAAATDSGRHLIIDLANGNGNTIVQNLYGHDADVYSSPKLAWSRNGQYIYCNTQHDAKLVVYHIASGQQVVNTLKTSSTSSPSPHVRPIKDVYSSPHTDMVVTTSFDRNVVIWFPQTQQQQ